MAGGFLAALVSAAEAVEMNFLWRPRLRDPADELILDAAVNGRAEAVVTHNVRNFRSATLHFGIPTLTPAEYLKELQR
jgi:predicted nucleic acid-binding protein